jgi:hypothetical protein
MPSTPPKDTRLLRIFIGPCIISLIGLILSGFTASTHTIAGGLEPHVLATFQALAGTWLLINAALHLTRHRRNRPPPP